MLGSRRGYPEPSPLLQFWSYSSSHSSPSRFSLPPYLPIFMFSVSVHPAPPHSVSLSLSLCLCLSPSVCLSPTLPTKEIKSGLCWQTASGLGPALEYVRQATPLEKTASQFPSSTRMSIAPQLGTTLYPPTLLHSEIFVPLELL